MSMLSQVSNTLSYCETRAALVQNLVALVGVQSLVPTSFRLSHTYAVQHGSHAIIGGPHAMTCDTTMLRKKGISFSLSEAELVWPTILERTLCAVNFNLSTDTISAGSKS